MDSNEHKADDSDVENQSTEEIELEPLGPLASSRYSKWDFVDSLGFTRISSSDYNDLGTQFFSSLYILILLIIQNQSLGNRLSP